MTVGRNRSRAKMDKPVSEVASDRFQIVRHRRGRDEPSISASCFIEGKSFEMTENSKPPGFVCSDGNLQTAEFICSDHRA